MWVGVVGQVEAHADPARAGPLRVVVGDRRHARGVRIADGDGGGRLARVGGAGQLRRLGRRRERAGAHQPLGVGGPEAGVQAGQRVEGVEQLLGEGKVRIGAGWHAYLPGRQTALAGRALPSSASSRSVPGPAAGRPLRRKRCGRCHDMAGRATRSEGGGGKRCGRNVMPLARPRGSLGARLFTGAR